jgi:hypothetical protein
MSRNLPKYMPTNWAAENVAVSPRWLTYIRPKVGHSRRKKVSDDTYLDTYRSIYIDQIYISEPLFNLLNFDILYCPTKETLQRADGVTKI